MPPAPPHDIPASPARQCTHVGVLGALDPCTTPCPLFLGSWLPSVPQGCCPAKLYTVACKSQEFLSRMGTGQGRHWTGRLWAAGGTAPQCQLQVVQGVSLATGSEWLLHQEHTW